MPPQRAAKVSEVATEVSEVATVKKRKKDGGVTVTCDSDEDVPLFQKFPRQIQTTTSTDSDDDKPLFSQAPQPPPPPPPPPQLPQTQPPPNFIDNPIVTNSRIRRQLDNVLAGCDKVTFQSPVPQANLEAQVELLAEAVYHFPRVKSLELQATASHFPLIEWILILFVFLQGVILADMPEAYQAVLDIVMCMRNSGRKFKFLGLSSTCLTDYQGRQLADMIRLLGPTNRGRDEWETIELHRVAFSELTRAALKDAGDRCGVNVLLSRDRGPALS